MGTLFTLKNITKYLFLICFTCSNLVMAWNSTGHRIIAQIAYDQLNKSQKHILQKYNSAFNSTQRKKYGVVKSAVWLDTLYSKEYSVFKPMHYIDYPFTENTNLSLPQISQVNALSALNDATNCLKISNKECLINANILVSNFDTLNTSQQSMIKTAIGWRMIMHIVGDIHQPLHAATRISEQYPEGDRGGNLLLLNKNRVAPNLHSYWDRGAGLWVRHKRYSAKQIKNIAKKIEKKYPCVMNKNDLDPNLWARESHEIAVTIVYPKLLNTSFIDDQYQNKAQYISEYRVSQAGCRLANLISLYAR